MSEETPKPVFRFVIEMHPQGLAWHAAKPEEGVERPPTALEVRGALREVLWQIESREQAAMTLQLFGAQAQRAQEVQQIARLSNRIVTG